MGARRTLTIGVTINLEHYENLRLEVNSEAESVAEAENLVHFLDEILGRFGREDPATAERVDSYRRRVLARSPPAEDQGGPVSVSPPERQQPMEAEAIAKTSGCRPGIQELAGSGTQPELQPPSPGPALPKTSALSCENCGGGVSTAEQKMSQLFTGKTLCRACIKKVQG